MITYRDLINVGEREEDRMRFVRSAISKHMASDAYRIAKTAEAYNERRNTTIVTYQKLLYTMTGEAVEDIYSPNYKLASGFFKRFVTQQVQYLLGNGVSWGDPATGERLGVDFDAKLQQLAKKALIGGVAFGFVNFDHLEVFGLTEFVPLYDEENGALRAGIRYWQIDAQKPLRATLYEEDGHTEYIWDIKRDAGGEVLREKRAYTQVVRVDGIDGAQIYDGENYPTFPIVPLWGNPNRLSEIVGIREQIDAYDLIKSGFCNTVDEASFIYWTLKNNGGADDVDLAQFIERIRTLKAANVPDSGEAEAHTIEAPYASREALLDRLRSDLYDDYMALDTKAIASGAVTATQIEAAYEPMNSKADEFEYCVLDFINGILTVAGIEDEPTFTRSMIVNQAEEITNIVSAGEYLDQEYITRRILTILGDADQAEEVLKRMSEEETIDLTEEDEVNGGSGARSDG